MAREIIEKTDEQFYSDAINYWSDIPATVDGMLGGFGYISLTDIKGSKQLLKQLFNSKCSPGRDYALDCGAGIGRITKFLLTDLFNKVDMVEQNHAFLERAKQYLGPKKDKVLNFYAVGLQDFKPEAKKYDVIWIQWVLGHLTNQDLLQFLENCKNGLKENGVIIIKENITASEEIELDRQDSSVTRPLKSFQDIFLKANLNCYRLVKQQHFPKGLFSVYMFVLRPKYKDNKVTLENISAKNDTDIQFKTAVNQKENFEQYFDKIENEKVDSMDNRENIQINGGVNNHNIDEINKIKIIEKEEG